MATVNTSWVSPTSATLDKATGATIDEAMTDGWSSDLYHLGGAQGYIGVRAYNVSPQSVADATAVALSLNAEQFDHDPNGSIHDAGGVPVSNTAVTIRTTGVYHLTGFVRFSPNTTGVRSASFRISGATTITQDLRDPTSGGNTTDIAIATAYLITTPDYVELVVYQSSGGALNVDSCALTVVKA
jgi:hypothetical protein